MSTRRTRGLAIALAVLAALPAIGCDNRSVTADPRTPAAPVRPDDDQLRQQIDEALDFTLAGRRLNLRDHAAWQIVHGAVAFQRDFQVDVGGRLEPAIDYLLQGGTMQGWRFQPGDMLQGRRGLRSVLEPGSKSGQGHADQWLGYLSGCDLTPDQTITVDGATYHLEDLVRQVEWDVPRNAAQEYSWTLMGLTTYRPSNYEWTAADGQTWSIAHLVEIEAGQDLNTSACGGSHRLVGLTLAVNRHLTQGGKLEGAWKLADERIQQAIATAREYQNPDGSFSANYFQRPGIAPDLAQALGTTGHTLEFLVLALDEQRVREEWVRRAAAFLASAFQRTQHVSLECGALYHAAHGLVFYRQRLFGPRTPPPAGEKSRAADDV